MTQSSQKVMSPSSGVNISGPVAGTFQHTKEVSMTQQKPAVRRPQIPIPDIPVQGEVYPSPHYPPLPSRVLLAFKFFACSEKQISGKLCFGKLIIKF